MKQYLNLIITIIILLLFVGCMIDTVYKDRIFIQQQAEKIALQDIKIRKLEKTPKWLLDAYDKCYFQKSTEKVLRECIAFEIKELNH